MGRREKLRIVGLCLPFVLMMVWGYIYTHPPIPDWLRLLP